ncbi:putative enoyl-CoA hydratase echA8 [Pirellula sp. SH-Sr6A]|uniref:thioesterase, FlK family n=1 Tax=Pirellula sp. SH-Sr6A TaxID=1632865 RepID=UPI00078CB544|nr:enoyl-CoA hydratase-related protein [Pirellula sp. SH-Sr6A]AMV33082.1 putative enoyl-CoA hydratase echA8 [Pirellula sp. SH-Sr6A]
MIEGLKVGDRAELTWTVGSEHTIHLGVNRKGFGDDGKAMRRSAVVFSTPNMILLMERAARKAIEPYLEVGEESVGAQVHIDHLAATPIGAQVTAFAQVTAIQGRAVDFDVTAFDEREMIGKGTHRRMVVSLDRIADRLEQKTPTHRNGTLIPMLATPNPGDLPSLSTLQVAVDDRVAKVLLNRPERRNAVDQQMTRDWEELNAWLAGHPDIRIVIIQGAADTFCSGDDVREVGDLSLEVARELSYRQARMYLNWENLPQIFIAAVDGNALGAGCVMACSCDFRIATYQATFGMPEILLGWSPGYGLSQLTALVGKAKAIELCTLGGPITAQQAMDCGLVHRLVARQQLSTATAELTQKLLAMPPMALRETKRLIHQDEGTQVKSTYVADTQAYVECLGTDDAREGIRAFLEKRPARFSR